MIVIVNGPLGVGKSELSWELLALFDKAVMLDGDYIGAVQPFDIYDDERIEYLYQTMQHLMAFHKEHGYSHFVINYVFESSQSLRRLRRLLSKIDNEDYAFRLTCSEEEIARRIRKRSDDPERLGWELQRFGELTTIQEKAALTGDLGYPIDTTHYSAQQAARLIWEILHEEVKLESYNPAWAELYQAERLQIAAMLGELAVSIEHIGSTAVPGLIAKPVIDLLVGVQPWESAERCIAPLSRLGYTFIDYAANTERCFFRKGMPRSHHLHIVEHGGEEWCTHLDFRNALRADPALRVGYQALKIELAGQHGSERAKYSEKKSEYVRRAVEQWRKI